MSTRFATCTGSCALLVLLGAIVAAPSARAQDNAAIPVVAVFGIEDARPAKLRLTADQLSNLTDYLTTKLAAGGAFKIVPNSDLKDALAEKKKGSYNVCYDTSCQIEIGKELAAQKTLATKILSVGKQCVVAATLYDLRQSASEKSAVAEGACDEDSLGSALRSVAEQLGAKGRAPPAPGATAGPAPGPAIDSATYERLAREADAARKEAEAKKASDAERRAAIERAWTALRKYAETENIDGERRIAELEKFLRDMGSDNPFAADAAALINAIRAEAGEMVTVPGGAFFMGCNEEVDNQCDEDEKPGRRVEVKSFSIDKTEVTVAMYARCVRAGACTAKGMDMPYYDGKDQVSRATYCNWGKEGRESHPINCIDWSQARAFCTWAKKRLPTEIEWEKAARGTDGRKYPWGNATYGRAGRVANIQDEAAKKVFSDWTIAEGYDDGYVGTAPVGSYPSGASPYGALDMIGNVQEWCSDLSGENRAARGASWNTWPSSARASFRNWRPAFDRGEMRGVRCVK